ncbi:MBOAT family protein [Campylobacter sp. JMF_06 NA1]|uniref:MBOAT family O-acyltransferase n=1 Tax=Campylobacter sp. JMF_06 NA1 TaxID=2983823 RepID=UPI0022E9B2DF|nr:MBOAT family O-acyltransferase [Campylobacter sp. JMF_06 NA1]MDA3078038.1 MBOAT family protein [Campylobacter sp. JMF_06 NA1]
MLFNSPVFIFAFLPITFFVYFWLNHKRLSEAAKAFLVVASLFFYSWWNPAYLPLILVSMVFNFTIGSYLSRNFGSANLKKQISPKTLLIIGICGNVALLGYFKYADFFILNTNFIFGTKFEFLKLTLPLAISFFTFQQIAYLVDSYKGETKEYDFLSYALFVSFFPQLIAGPIVHHKEMMPQFAKLKNKVKNYGNILLGLFIFSMGLFKKVVIADTFAVYATQGFDKMEVLEFFTAWQTSLSYTFQLYFDFSGYCDMAIGAALLFNIRLPINFNSPYKACDIQDFWRRWHITLGRFLRDYIYIPLGGNRGGLPRTCANLFATFLIGGIWHGAGWTFVFWGFLHGIALVIHRLWSLTKIKLPKILAWIITFNFVNFAWVFFRANSFDDAIKVLKGMVGINGVDLSSLTFWRDKTLLDFALKILYNDYQIFLFYILIFTLFFIVFFKNSLEFSKYKITLKWTIYFSMIFFIAIFSMLIGTYSEFIYFNF